MKMLHPILKHPNVRHVFLYGRPVERAWMELGIEVESWQVVKTYSGHDAWVGKSIEGKIFVRTGFYGGLARDGFVQHDIRPLMDAIEALG
jgi:hypothetical protein